MGRPSKHLLSDVATSPEEYSRFGLGPVQGDAKELYLDMVKRILINIVYQDRPNVVYDHRNVPEFVSESSLSRRANGEDLPVAALTMVGARRLENVKRCMESVLVNNVRGDFIETGALKGGSCIFMRGRSACSQRDRSSSVRL